MHSHAKTSAEIDGNLIYVSFIFLRKSRGKVLKKNCSPGILSASLDGLVPRRACGATGRLAWLIASRQATCPPASKPRWMCYIRSRVVEPWLRPKIEFAGSQLRRCSHGAVSPCCWEQKVVGATAPKRLGTARRLQASLFGRALQHHHYGLGRGCGVGRSLGIGLGLGVGVGRGVEVAVAVGLAVGVGLGGGVTVAVGVAVAVAVGVAVAVAVGVVVAVAVGVGVDVAVAVGVGVNVAVALGVAIGVDVGVAVGVAVAV